MHEGDKKRIQNLDENLNGRDHFEELSVGWGGGDNVRTDVEKKIVRVD
jgi:hypothetical protein